MASAVIGALRVVIGADSAALEKGLGSAQSALSKFASSSGLIAAGIAGIISGAVAEIASSMSKAIDQADQLGKAAQKVGIPVEELSKLKYAADLNNVAFDTLTKSLTKFDVALAEAAAGTQNNMSRALDVMGISIRNSDGSLKEQTQLVGEVADKFATYKDSAEKTALAQELFGKGAANLIPLLNQGKAGIQAAGAEAEKFGLVVTKSTADAADQFNTNMARIAAASQGAWNQITAAALPALVKISEAFVGAKGSGETFAAVGSAIGTALQVIATAAAAAVASVSAFASILSTVVSAGAALVSGDFAGARQALVNFRSEIEKTGSDTVKQFQTIWGQIKPPDIGPVIQKNVTAPVAAAADGAKSALDRYLDSVNKSTAVHQALGDTSGKTAAQIAYLKTTTEAYAIANQNGIPITDALRAKIEATGQAAAAAAQQQQASQLSTEGLAPWEEYNKKLERNKQLLDQGLISLDQYNRLNRKVAVDAGVAWDVAGASIAGSLATIAGTYGKTSSAMATAAKAFAIVQATLSVYTGMAKALELTFPANIAAVAAVAAQGFAFIANIKSQAVPKFALGGSFRVPGGLSTSDTQLVPLALAAGERVDVTPASEASGVGQTISVELRGQEFYSRDHVAKLISTINDMTADGYRLKVASR